MDATTKAKRQPKPDKVRMVADDVVTPNSLATHLGRTRQNIARLVAEAVIEQRSDGHFDQTASRLRYIKYLREQHRHSPRTQADAAHTAIKTEMLQLRLMEKKRELVTMDEFNSTIDEIAGVMLTALSSMPAQCAPVGDLATRRRFEAWVFKTRTEIADIAQRKADEARELALGEQG